MLDYEKINNTLDKIMTIADKTSSGIGMLKEMLEIFDPDDSVQLPQILNREEVQQLINEVDDPFSREAIALKTYCIFADSMAEYSNYLVEEYQDSSDDSSVDNILIGSVDYITKILVRIQAIFESFKKLKYGSKLYLPQINQFGFIMELLADRKDLVELYSYDFLSDVSEMWELIVEIIDQINDECDVRPFSEVIDNYYDSLAEVDEKNADAMSEAYKKREKKKVLKTYTKFIKKFTKEFSKQIEYEITRLTIWRIKNA